MYKLKLTLIPWKYVIHLKFCGSDLCSCTYRYKLLLNKTVLNHGWYIEWHQSQFAPDIIRKNCKWRKSLFSSGLTLVLCSAILRKIHFSIGSFHCIPRRSVTKRFFVGESTNIYEASIESAHNKAPMYCLSRNSWSLPYST